MASGTALGRIVRSHLADDEGFIAPPCECFANQLFGAAFAVHLGGIDQGEAEV